MTKIDTEELYAFNKLLKESKEGLDQKIKQSNYAIAGFSKEDKLTGGAWSSAKNHFDKGYTPLIDSFDSALVLLVDKFSDYTTEFRQQVTGGSVVLDTDQLEDLEIRMQNLASYKVQWLLDMADQLAGIPGIGKFFDEVSLNSTKKEVILLRKFQEFEHSHRNEFDEIAEALHFLGIGLEAVGNKKNFQGATKGFGPIDFNKDSRASNLSKFNERNKDKVDFIKESDAMAAAAVVEQTAQIHNAQMNVNQMADAMMNEINSTNSYNYNPVGGKTWFTAEGFDVNNSSKRTKLNFADTGKLKNHFSKHGAEFGGVYSDADAYLFGANNVITNGMKVQYNYKLQDGTFELRTGYVAFMKNSSLYNANGVPKKSYAKFEFVGTNNNGEITTYHLESGKTFWKMMNNGENIPVIHPIE